MTTSEAVLLIVVVALIAVFAALTFLSVRFGTGRSRTRLAEARREAPSRWIEEDSGSGTRRVLVVAPNDRGWEKDEQDLRAAGYAVVACHGPVGRPESFPHSECLILADGRCPLAAEADAIVFGLELSTGVDRMILRSYADTYPGVPLFVRASDRESEWYARLLHNSEVRLLTPGGPLAPQIEPALAMTG
jgi:hypothetical protein